MSHPAEGTPRDHSAADENWPSTGAPSSFHDDLLRHRPDDPSLGDEGYRLDVTAGAASN